MAGIRPIETVYNGYRFRSRLEARWAVFFDAAGIPYEYEPEGFVLGNGTAYLPDFYLPWFRAFVEIKPKSISEYDADIAEDKCFNLIADKPGNIALLCKGDPVDMEMTIICSKYEESIQQYVPWIDSAVWVEGAEGYDWVENDKAYIPFMTTKHYIGLAVGPEKDADKSFNPEFLMQRSRLTGWRSQLEKYRARGREARFEHGETPIVRR